MLILHREGEPGFPLADVSGRECAMHFLRLVCEQPPVMLVPVGIAGPAARDVVQPAKAARDLLECRVDDLGERSAAGDGHRVLAFASALMLATISGGGAPPAAAAIAGPAGMRSAFHSSAHSRSITWTNQSAV
jgi:hypothetical protein